MYISGPYIYLHVLSCQSDPINYSLQGKWPALVKSQTILVSVQPKPSGTEINVHVSVGFNIGAKFLFTDWRQI